MVAAAAVSLLRGLGAAQGGFASTGPRRIGGDGYVVGFLGRAPEHAVEFAGHNASDGGGFVCDSASLFRIRCTGGLVCRQWSE